MTKYQEYFQKMMEDRFMQFDHFRKIHDHYVKDPDKWKVQFNSEGALILDIIREWERRLCHHSEKGQYGKFSANLADKFWGEVRKVFPKIDFIGVE